MNENKYDFTNIKNKKIIKSMEKYANENKVPILRAETANFIKDKFKNKKINNILEIGTAIGFSSLFLCESLEADITTIEKDKKSAELAKKYFNSCNLKNKIRIINEDAITLNINLIIDEKFDLIFIDASKKNNKFFFEKFNCLLKKEGYVITDNINFKKNEKKENIPKRLIAIVNSITEYNSWLEKNIFFKTDFYNIGDGISISKKLGENN